jgi:hypothetical protein
MSLTPDLISRLAVVARSGVSLDGCARYCGLTADVLADWWDRGRKAARLADAGHVVPHVEAIYLSLFRALEEARGQREAEAVLAVRAGGDHWQSEAFFLERVHPGSFGSRELRSAPDAILGDRVFLDRLRADIVDDEPEGLHGDDDSWRVSAYLRRYPGRRPVLLRDLPLG